jgi:hypothetical protein
MKKLIKILGGDIRRTMGSIGFICCIFAMFHPDIPTEEFYNLLYMSSALLGTTALDKFTGKGGG